MQPAFLGEVGKALLDRFRYGFAFLPAPRSVAIGPTYRCNFNCLFCIEHSPLEFPAHYRYYKEKREYLDSEIDPEIFKRTVDDLAALGVECVMLCDGGESFLHPQIFSLIEYVKAKGLSCWIATNGSLLDREKVRRLIALKLDMIHISLNAASAPVHAHVHGAAAGGSFERIVEHARLFGQLKEETRTHLPQVCLSNVITKCNYREVVEMVRLGARLCADRVELQTFFYCKGREPYLQEIILGEEERRTLLELLLEAALQARQLRVNTNINQMIQRVRTNTSLTFQVQEPLIYRCDMQANADIYPYYFPERMGTVTRQAGFCSLWFSPHFIRYRRRLSVMARQKHTYEGYPYCLRCHAGTLDRKLCYLRY